MVVPVPVSVVISVVISVVVPSEAMLAQGCVVGLPVSGSGPDSGSDFFGLVSF